MCMSSPNIPAPPPPPQEIKQPETAGLKDSAKRNRSGIIGGGSLLTGPAGVASSSTARNSLLGG